jgi:hypothetical protein
MALPVHSLKYFAEMGMGSFESGAVRYVPFFMVMDVTWIVVPSTVPATVTS